MQYSSYNPVVRIIQLFVSLCIMLLLSTNTMYDAFTCHNHYHAPTKYHTSTTAIMEATTEMSADSAVESSSDIDVTTIPKNLPSAVGKDYVPLATMLATGQFAEADQVCC
jgi:hypothetical protein